MPSRIPDTHSPLYYQYNFYNDKSCPLQEPNKRFFLKKRQKRNKKRKIQQSEPFKEKHELPVRQCCFSRAKRGLSGFDLAL